MLTSFTLSTNLYLTNKCLAFVSRIEKVLKINDAMTKKVTRTIEFLHHKNSIVCTHFHFPTINVPPDVNVYVSDAENSDEYDPKLKV